MVVKALEKVLHFVIEPQVQFYATIYKSRKTRQKSEGARELQTVVRFDQYKFYGELVLHLNVEILLRVFKLRGTFMVRFSMKSAFKIFDEQAKQYGIQTTLVYYSVSEYTKQTQRFAAR